MLVEKVSDKICDGVSSDGGTLLKTGSNNRCEDFSSDVTVIVYNLYNGRCGGASSGGDVLIKTGYQGIWVGASSDIFYCTFSSALTSNSASSGASSPACRSNRKSDKIISGPSSKMLVHPDRLLE